MGTSVSFTANEQFRNDARVPWCRVGMSCIIELAHFALDKRVVWQKDMWVLTPANLISNGEPGWWSTDIAARQVGVVAGKVEIAR